ncbi:MAG: hypothetical protein SGARI_004957 [Bacillariaceae sp.]
MYWFQDPIPSIQRLNVDVALAVDPPNKYILCTCFMYYKANSNRNNNVDDDNNKSNYHYASNLLQAWNDRLQRTKAKYNQGEFNKEFNVFIEKHPNMTWTTLDKFQYPSGTKFYAKRWKKSNNKNLMVAHANWVSGRENKIAKLKQKGIWKPNGDLRPCVT